MKKEVLGWVLGIVLFVVAITTIMILSMYDFTPEYQINGIIAEIDEDSFLIRTYEDGKFGPYVYVNMEKMHPMGPYSLKEIQKDSWVRIIYEGSIKETTVEGWLILPGKLRFAIIPKQDN